MSSVPMPTLHHTTYWWLPMHEGMMDCDWSVLLSVGCMMHGYMRIEDDGMMADKWLLWYIRNTLGQVRYLLYKTFSSGNKYSKTLFFKIFSNVIWIHSLSSGLKEKIDFEFESMYPCVTSKVQANQNESRSITQHHNITQLIILISSISLIAIIHPPWNSS